MNNIKSLDGSSVPESFKEYELRRKSLAKERESLDKERRTRDYFLEKFRKSDSGEP